MAPRKIAPLPRDPTQIELAYVAGFFDGEGCVYLNALKDGRVQLRVKISQKDRRPLDLIHDAFGGSVCVAVNRKRNTECWNWGVVSAQAERFLLLIQPFCRVKSEAIVIALKYRQLVKPTVRPGIGPRWNPYTDDEKAAQMELRRQLHAVNSWRDRPLKEERSA